MYKKRVIAIIAAISIVASNFTVSAGEEKISVTITIGVGDLNTDFALDDNSLKPYRTKNGDAMENKLIEVTDRNDNGLIDFGDAVLVAHELYALGGTSDYGANSSGFINRVWGVSNGGYCGYNINGNTTNEVMPKISDGDRLTLANYGIYLSNIARELSDSLLWGDNNSGGHVHDYSYYVVSYEDGTHERYCECMLWDFESEDTYIDEDCTYKLVSADEDTHTMECIYCEYEFVLEHEFVGKSCVVCNEQMSDDGQEPFLKGDYINKSAANLKPSMGVGDWTTIRAALEGGIDMSPYSITKGETNTAALAMKNVFIANDEESKKLLATRPDFMTKAGAYTMSYCLMALDSKNYWVNGEKIAKDLNDWKTTTSLRDDTIYTILNTAACWGGSWFTLDTGCQNAQALVPYAGLYKEVRQKLDMVLSSYYEQIMAIEYKDASSAGEFIRFAAIYGDMAKAQAVYEKFLTLSESNWKQKGNALDLQRMSLGESALKGIYRVSIYTDSVTTEDTSGESDFQKEDDLSKEWSVNFKKPDGSIYKTLILKNEDRNSVGNIYVEIEKINLDGSEFGGWYCNGEKLYTYTDKTTGRHIVEIKPQSDTVIDIYVEEEDELYFIDLANGGVKVYSPDKVRLK